MSDVKWIKVCTNIFDDEKMLLIDTLPKSDTILVIWFKLLCLAGKINNGGVFLLNDNIPYSTEMLSKIFRRKKTTVENAIKVFEEYGLIEIVDDVITIPNWGKHQSLDSIEKKKEYMKNYMQDYREKQRSKADKSNRKANSKTNVSRTDKEEEKEEDKNNNKRFVPPTVEEVRAYCQERNNGVDAQRFINFYESKGWMVGKNRMKDWKASVRTWEGRENNGPSNTGNTTADEERRNRGIDEVIRRIESGEADHDDDGLWDDLPQV